MDLLQNLSRTPKKAASPNMPEQVRSGVLHVRFFDPFFVVLCMSKCQVDGGKDATAEQNQPETEVDDKYSHVM